jgi:ubiquitin carboxyl-terminal hydrolase L5
MEVARPLIQERMLQYEGDQIRFNLLALCKSPLLTKPIELAINIQSLRAVESRLDELRSDWRQFLIDDMRSDSVLRGPNPAFRINHALLDSAKLCKAFSDKLYDQTSTVEAVFPMREELLHQQQQIRADLIDEIAAVEQDNERALSRRYDYTPMLHTWLRFLAENGALEDLLKVVEQGGQI